MRRGAQGPAAGLQANHQCQRAMVRARNVSSRDYAILVTVRRVDQILMLCYFPIHHRVWLSPDDALLAVTTGRGRQYCLAKSRRSIKHLEVSYNGRTTTGLEAQDASRDW